jgi:hypothetical protein
MTLMVTMCNRLTPHCSKSQQRGGIDKQDHVPGLKRSQKYVKSLIVQPYSTYWHIPINAITLKPKPKIASIRILQTTQPLPLKEVREFMIACLEPSAAYPSWVHFDNRSRITHVALLYVHGLSEKMLQEPPYINGIFEDLYKTHVAGNNKSALRDPFFDLIQCPMTKMAKRRQMEGKVSFQIPSSFLQAY